MFFAPALRTRACAPSARAFDREFERFLNESFVRPGARPRVEQDEQAWTVSLDIPGVAREHLAIEIDGAVVRIQTQADAPRKVQAAYELPAEIDADATTAKLENGVLTLRLARKQPVVTSRKVEVQ